MSPLDSCTFTLQSDGNRISYYVESGVIKSKTFKLEGKTKGPFKLTSLDTPKSSKIKVKAATGLYMKLYTDPEIYLQSSEENCTGNVYTLVIYFNSKQRAEEVVVLGLEDDPDERQDERYAQRSELRDAPRHLARRSRVWSHGFGFRRSVGYGGDLGLRRVGNAHPRDPVIAPTISSCVKP